LSGYNFIVDNIRYSFSSVTTFETCKHAFKLTYIEAKDRGTNFYAEYGSFFHRCLQLYFEGHLDINNIGDYYKKYYCEHVVASPPIFHKNAAETYYNNGLVFFDNFNFDKEKYDIKIIEDSIESKYNDIDLIVKPDLVLFDKERKKTLLVDFKTANGYKNGKLDTTKMKGYLKQMLLYATFLWLEKNIVIDEIQIWFVINNKIETIPLDIYKAQDNLEWFLNTIEEIKKEENFEANTSNQFFCNNLCGMGSICEYRNNI
jgi:hypothetical protein